MKKILLFALAGALMLGALSSCKKNSDPDPKPIAVTGVSLDRNVRTLFSVVPGAQFSGISLKATVTPEDAANKAVAWSSSNPDVVTVDGAGKVVGLSRGTATITATTVDGGKTASCVVNVDPITRVTFDSDALTMAPGETKTIGGTYAPADANFASLSSELIIEGQSQFQWSMAKVSPGQLEFTFTSTSRKGEYPIDLNRLFGVGVSCLVKVTE